jgi:predicted permease
MESIWRDLRFAWRQLLENKGFSAAAILTLTLGIGAAATILTMMDAVLLKELPYRSPAALVVLQGTFKDKGDAHNWPIAQRDLADWRERSTAFAAVSVWGTLAFNLEQGEQSQRLSGELVNASYFPILGLAPQAGRFFTADEDARPLEQYVVVLSDGLWRTTFGADPGVVGRKLRLNGKLYQVVGVAPRGFRGLSDLGDVWVPSMLPPIRDYVTDRSIRWASGVARLKPGVSVRQAQHQMDGVTAGLAQELPDADRGLGAAIVPLDEYWFGKLRRGLLVLGAGAAILLLIACINVGSLLLARAAARQRAWGIRVALGASRRRLVRQMLTESILLALVGAAAGLLLATWATRALIAASGTQFPSFVHVGVEPPVILATLALAVGCGLVFGLAPIAISFRSDLSQTLGRNDKVQERGQGWVRFQNLVVVAQVALALTLSLDAAMMAKGFRKMVGENLGFQARDLLTFRVDLRGPRYIVDDFSLKRLREEYLPRMSAVPGVGQLAMAVSTIPTDDWAGGRITVEDHNSEAADGTYVALIHAVTPAYFDVLGVPLRKGRAFDLHDTQSNAVVVSQAMADQQWPGRDPIGKRLKLGPRGKQGMPWLTVVGVVADVRHEGFGGEKPPAPDMYVSLLQFLRRPLTVNFLVRPRPGISTAQLRPALHREMKAIDPELPDYDIATMQERLAKQTGKARFQLLLIGIFSSLALVLGIVGIYGVVSYGVAQRTREIAVRMALGANRGSILRLVVARGAALAAAGLLLGLVTVVSSRGMLDSLLYRTSLADPLLLGGTCCALFLVTLAANVLPARRAAVVDPVAGLRLQ